MNLAHRVILVAFSIHVFCSAYAAYDPILYLSDEPRGSLMIDFTQIRNDGELSLAMEAAGISIDSSVSSLPVLSKIPSDMGQEETVLINVCENHNSRAIPLNLRIISPANRISILAGNGATQSDIKHVALARGRLVAFDGTSVLAVAEKKVDGLARSKLTVESSTFIQDVMLSYGSSQQEEAISAITIYGGMEDSLAVSAPAASGQRQKIKIAWLDQKMDGETIKIRAVAALKSTDARNAENSPFNYRVDIIILMNEISGGNTLRELNFSVFVPHAADFRDGPFGRITTIIIEIPWDGKDRQGNRIGFRQIEQTLTATALRVEEDDQDTPNVHYIDSASLIRRATPNNIRGLVRLDGTTLARTLMERSNVSTTPSSFRDISELLSSNPESAYVFLDAALDQQRYYRERVRALWYLIALRNKTVAEIAAYLADDSDMSVALQAKQLLEISTQW